MRMRAVSCHRKNNGGGEVAIGNQFAEMAGRFPGAEYR